MRHAGSLSMLLAAVTVIAATSTPSLSARSFLIQPGLGIGPVALKMTQRDVKKVLGVDVPLRVRDGRETMEFSSHRLEVWFSTGRVVGVRTTNPGHKTVSNYGSGDENWAGARQALCNGGLREASAEYKTNEAGFEIYCPLQGITIEVSQGRIAAFTVVPAYRLR